MRLILDLRANMDFAYDTAYNAKLQGVFYELLSEAGYAHVHDSKGYKFFTFSNPFPIPHDMKVKEGDEIHVLFASPDELLVKRVQTLIESIHIGHEFNIGPMQFILKGVHEVRPVVRNGMVLATATPVIVRIPEKMYDELGVPQGERRRGFVFWRPSMGTEAFLRAVERNLAKKWCVFYGGGCYDSAGAVVFEMAKLERAPIVIRVPIDGADRVMVGSRWRFYFTSAPLGRRRAELLRFALDVGIGERNSMGFGFLNIVYE